MAAEGGPVNGGRTYLVGEHGPELIVPLSKGRIIPNVSEREQAERIASAIMGHRYPRVKHWKAAAFLRGICRVWPAPKRLHAWIAANSLRDQPDGR